MIASTHVRMLVIPPLQDLGALLPECTVLIAAVALLLMSAAPPLRNMNASRAALLFSLIALAVSVITFPSSVVHAFGGAATVDGLAGFARILFSAVLIVVILISRYDPRTGRSGAGYYSLLFFLTTGAMLMASSGGAVMMMLSLEIVSISSYVLVAVWRGGQQQAEAGMKYILYGATASALMIYGLSWMYGFTGTLSFSGHEPWNLLFRAGPIAQAVMFMLVISGIAFKISAVPFHFWSPDVYQATPYPVAAFFSVVPKAAGFLLLMRFLAPLTAGFSADSLLFILLAAMSVLSMFVGNLAALRQENVFRMMAFSGVAQSGYMLMGLLGGPGEGWPATAFYLGVYACMNLGIFALLGFRQLASGEDSLPSFRATTPPAASLVLWVVFCAALTGLPVTAGFSGKLSLMTGLFAFRGNVLVVWILLLSAVLNTVLSLWVYMRIPAYMVFSQQAVKSSDRLLGTQRILLILMAIPLVWLGIFHFGQAVSWLGSLFTPGG